LGDDEPLCRALGWAMIMRSAEKQELHQIGNTERIRGGARLFRPPG
jgi:hypothetical protein